MLKQAELFEYLKKEATEEAQGFANEMHLDATKITEKIAEQRDLIVQLGDSISVQPGTSSRYWIDCYIAALEGILESLRVTP